MDLFDVKEKDQLDLLKSLIKINSINPSLVSEGKGEAEIADYIGNYLTKMGLRVEYQDVQNDRKNVIGIFEGEKNGKTILLNGHIDTVSTSGMEIEPFNPVFKEGKVYGRGASDMKCGLAAMIMAVQYLIRNRIKLNGNVILAFVIDEEYASLGTEKLIEQYIADGAIICEPTGLNIVLAHKGFVWSKVEVRGKAAHGSMVGFGVDAIVKAGKFLVKLEELEKNKLSLKKHPLLGTPSVHASLIKGGIELSTYPDYCSIELERRTLPDENKELVSKEIGDIIEEIYKSDKNFKADHDEFFYRPGLEISKDQQIVQSLITAYTEVLKKKPQFMGSSGWMDSAILAGKDIPTAIFGPAGFGNHGPVEYVNFNSVVSTTKILIKTIMTFCGLN